MTMAKRRLEKRGLGECLSVGLSVCCLFLWLREVPAETLKLEWVKEKERKKIKEGRHQDEKKERISSWVENKWNRKGYEEMD